MCVRGVRWGHGREWRRRYWRIVLEAAVLDDGLGWVDGACAAFGMGIWDDGGCRSNRIPVEISLLRICDGWDSKMS